MTQQDPKWRTWSDHGEHQFGVDRSRELVAQVARAVALMKPQSLEESLFMVEGIAMSMTNIEESVERSTHDQV